jgi:hypothetical protein
MLKKVFVYILFIYTFLLIPAQARVFAQDLSLNPVASSTPVQYELSYPGLLPDHPLYFLKAGRDRVMSFFISNPVKKAEFNLLQADKRIHASQLLLKKGGDKIDLAQSTFSKSENYFEGAIQYAEEAGKQGVNIEELAKKLHTANRKHRQVFNDMMRDLNENDRKKFFTEAKRLIDFENRIIKLVNNK